MKSYLPVALVLVLAGCGGKLLDETGSFAALSDGGIVRVPASVAGRWTCDIVTTAKDLFQPDNHSTPISSTISVVLTDDGGGALMTFGSTDPNVARTCTSIPFTVSGTKATLSGTPWCASPYVPSGDGATLTGGEFIASGASASFALETREQPLASNYIELSLSGTCRR